MEGRVTTIDWVMLGAVVLVIIAILNPPSGKPPACGPYDPWGYQ